MSVGSELRRAREQAGFSREQIAQNTKFQLYKIEALEEDAFERLPDGIYLDGLVRAYTKEVGLDADTYVERVREAAALAAADWITPVDVDEFPHEDTFAAEGVPHGPPPVGRDLDVVDRARADDALPPDPPRGHVTTLPIDELPSAPATRPAVEARETAAAALAPNAVPQRRRGWAALGLPAIAMVAAIGWGAYLYQSTRPFDGAEETDIPAVTHTLPPGSAAETDSRAANPEGRQAPRTSDTPPPEQSVAGTDATRAARAADVPDRHGDPRVSTPPPAPPEATARAESPAPPAAPPAARVSRDRAGIPSPAAAAGEERKSTTPEARDSGASTREPLAGVWSLSTEVESSSVRSYEGLRLGYQLELQQEGSRVTGVGRKVAENGRPLRGAGQTPISLEGTIEGNRLTLNFRERGTRRESAGKFVLLLDDDGTMQGRFSSDAARSGGTAIARRQ
jgi:transcriptional regulator with XRE-family HTH domain